MSVVPPQPAISAAGSDTGTPLNLAKRIALIAQRVNLRNRTLIDCGCGAGEYVLALCQQGADAIGVEYSAEKVARFAAANPDSHRVATGDIQHLDFADARFDFALLNEVLEHVPDDRQALREVHRILKPGGAVIIFSPNRLYPFETHGVHLHRSRRRVPHYVPFIPYVPLPLGRRVFDYWARNYWPSELRRRVTEAGFQVQDHGFIWQTFENISGNQPWFIRVSRPWLRRLSSALEAVPGIRAFGVSQVIIARRF